MHVGDNIYLPTKTERPYQAPPAPGVEEAPPEAGILPPGSRLPFGRNALFIGRQEDLQTLARLLCTATSRVVVMGWGGVGKTQLAVEFAHRYGRFFAGGVFWLNASAEDTLQEPTWPQCGLTLGLQPWPDKRPEQIAAVLGHGRARRSGWSCWTTWRRRPWPDLAPPAGRRRARPLVTARRSRWPADLGLTKYPLGVWHGRRAWR